MEESSAQAAAVERTPRLDWAGLLRRTFALDVFACSRCGAAGEILDAREETEAPRSGRHRGRRAGPGGVRRLFGYSM